MSWHKIILSVEQVTNGEEGKIQDEFSKLFMQAGAPKGVALFSGDLLHNDTTEIYFSPEASQMFIPLIRSYSGIPCEAPSRKDVGLLVGHDSARDDLLHD